MHHILLSALTCLLLLPHGLAHAEDTVTDDTPKPSELTLEREKVDDAAQKANEAALAKQEAYEKMRILTEKLSDQQKKHFYLIYDNHNMIEAVKSVQKSVQTGVESCRKNNPDMSDDIETRFKTWKDNVGPVIKESEGALSNMIIAQDYAAKSEIKDILKAVDKSRLKASEQIEKIPVSTPEACEFLLAKMDDTEETVIELLRPTLVSVPKLLHDHGWDEDKPEDDEQTSDSADDSTTKDAESEKE